MGYIADGDSPRGNTPMFFAAQVMHRAIRTPGATEWIQSVKGLPKALAQVAVGEIKVCKHGSGLIKYLAAKVALKLPSTVLQGTGITASDLERVKMPEAGSLGQTTGSIGE